MQKQKSKERLSSRSPSKSPSKERPLSRSHNVASAASEEIRPPSQQSGRVSSRKGTANAERSKKNSPFLDAVSANDTKAISKLRQGGLSIEEVNVTNSAGNTALIFATLRPKEYESYELVKTVVEMGGDVNLQNREGMTALMYATSKNHRETVKLLLSSGALVGLENTVYHLRALRCFDFC